jgi:hypothetical protein
MTAICRAFSVWNQWLLIKASLLLMFGAMPYGASVMLRATCHVQRNQYSQRLGNCKTFLWHRDYWSTGCSIISSCFPFERQTSPAVSTWWIVHHTNNILTGQTNYRFWIQKHLAKNPILYHLRKRQESLNKKNLSSDNGYVDCLTTLYQQHRWGHNHVRSQKGGGRRSLFQFQRSMSSFNWKYPRKPRQDADTKHNALP